jgi:TolB-like protein/class 3 adenylate cyclase/predicted Zn-dependent protease
MTAESNAQLKLEIAHILFIDVVGYSKLLIDDQREIQQQLNDVVRNAEEIRLAEAETKLVRLPTGDGMALVFYSTQEAPLRCAVQIAEALTNHPQLKLRMGIHTGPVSGVADVNERSNIAGAGINIAQRVMDCGDAGHILLSKRAAEDLAQYRHWQPYLHDLGQVEVKHRVKIDIVNLHSDKIGNPELPSKLRQEQKRQGALRRRKRALIAALIFLAVAIPLTLSIFLRRPPQTLAATIREKTIAVLPFENLSADKEDAFFADGIQDDVLTSLGKIKELTVIARPSVMVYRGAALGGKLREIGKTLGVAHVLAGSVRRSANRVVVSVQLIDTRDDHQLWSERYERTLSDALSLQGELAIEIARELRATLTPAEKSVVATKPTDNPDAYVLYLRARELEGRFQPPDDVFEEAVRLYQRAIDLDPKFALGRARMSVRLTYLASNIPKKGSTRAQQALAEAEEALRLQPNLGEARLALGYCYYEAGKFDRALAELARAGELIPNSAEVWNKRALIYRQQGKLRERIAALQHAETLDPRDTNNRADLGITFYEVRNWAEAIRLQTQTRAMLPDPKPFAWGIATAKFRMTSVLDPLKEAIAEASLGTRPQDVETVKMARFEVAMFERDYPAAERYLSELSPEPADAWQKLMHEAFLAVARGADPAEAERLLLRTRQEVEKLLTDNPAANIRLYGTLGLIDAFLGRKEDAIRAGRRGVELQDSPLGKNNASAALALIYARTGESDEAIKLIEKLLTLPATLGQFTISSMAQANLKWRWVWDPLRSNPRFQKILAGPEPKTVY